jgi:hypothetical protein
MIPPLAALQCNAAETITASKFQLRCTISASGTSMLGLKGRSRGPSEYEAAREQRIASDQIKRFVFAHSIRVAASQIPVAASQIPDECNCLSLAQYAHWDTHGVPQLHKTYSSFVTRVFVFLV